MVYGALLIWDTEARALCLKTAQCKENIDANRAGKYRRIAVSKEDANDSYGSKAIETLDIGLSILGLRVFDL